MIAHAMATDMMPIREVCQTGPSVILFVFLESEQGSISLNESG